MSYNYLTERKVKDMTEEEQRRIIAKNIRRYLDLRHMQQKELAKAIGEKPGAVNTWCMAKATPPVSKIEKLAEFFGCLKTDLIDDHSAQTVEEEYDEVVFKLGMTDEFFQRMAIDYYHLSPEEKENFKNFYEMFVMRKG